MGVILLKNKLIILFICISLFCSTNIFAGNNVNILLNGEIINNTDYFSFVDENNRTMVSIRWVSEQLKYKVDWNDELQIALIHDNKNLIKLQANSDEIFKNDTLIKMDTTAVIKNNRLFIPIRFFAECIDINIEWNKGTNTIYLLEPERILYKDEYFGVLMPKGLDKTEFKTIRNNYDNYMVVEFYDSQSTSQIFSLAYFDLDYWLNEVKENFSIQYTELYKNNDKIMICVFVSDVQYDAESKDRYTKLYNTIGQICDSLFMLDN